MFSNYPQRANERRQIDDRQQQIKRNIMLMNVYGRNLLGWNDYGLNNRLCRNNYKRREIQIPIELPEKTMPIEEEIITNPTELEYPEVSPITIIDMERAKRKNKPTNRSIIKEMQEIYEQPMKKRREESNPIKNPIEERRFDEEDPFQDFRYNSNKN